MDSHSARCAALMSIHPEFAELILTGEKRVEFRRRPLAREATHIVIYATSPISAVVGVAEISRVAHGSPSALWSAFGSVGGIGRTEFFGYFDGTGRGVAYVLRRARACLQPVPLGKSGLPGRPPQAFQYLGDKALDVVLGHCSNTANARGLLAAAG